MTAYDTDAALDDLFDDLGDDEPDNEPNNEGGAGSQQQPTPATDVARRTSAILAGRAPSASVSAVLELARDLPRLDDVREVDEDDFSDLTEIEEQQKAQTETVMEAALAAADAAVWVLALALERAARGRWWRRTHDTYGAYVEAKLHRSAVYGRQLRANAPLALETARHTGVIPKPSHVKITAKTAKTHGMEAGVSVYKAVLDASAEVGENPTAEALMAVHKRLPAQLPPPGDEMHVVIERTTRETLGLEDGAGAPAAEAEAFESEGVDSNGSASIEAPVFESNIKESNGDASIEAPTDTTTTTTTAATTNPNTTEIIDAELVAHLDTLKDGLKELAAVKKTLTKAAFAAAASTSADAVEYERLRNAIMKRAGEIRNTALNAPTAT
ncbi:hypothetical protein [Streptomyces noursei]